MRLGWFCSTKNGLDFSHYGWHYAYSISAIWDASPQLGYSCNTKGQRVFFHTLVFLANHEARRRMAVFAIQLAWSHIRPASREARCRAAVLGTKAAETRGLPPSVSRAPSFSLRPCAPYGRAVRKGTQSPSSTSTKKGWPQCSHTGLSSKSMSDARIITVWPQLGQSKESS